MNTDLERRIAQAVVTLDDMVNIDTFSPIDETEREEYEHRVETLSKNWYILSRKSWLPSPREIARYGWKLSSSYILECKMCNIRMNIGDDGLSVIGEQDSSHLLKEYFSFNDLQFDTKLKQIGMLRYSHKPHCSFALIEIPLQYETIYAKAEIIETFRDQIPIYSPAPVYCFQSYYKILQNESLSLPTLSTETIKQIVCI